MSSLAANWQTEGDSFRFTPGYVAEELATFSGTLLRHLHINETVDSLASRHLCQHGRFRLRLLVQTR